MDGTLLDPSGRLTPRTARLVDGLHGRGVHVVPASGRQFHAITQASGLDGPEQFVIAENGGVLMCGGQALAVHQLPRAVAHAALAALEAADLRRGAAGAVLCTPDRAYIERSDADFHAAAAHYYTALETVPDLGELIEARTDLQVVKIAAYAFGGGDAEKLLAPVLDVPEVTTPAGRTEAVAVVSSAHWVDLMAPDVNKRRALAEVQRRLGVGPEHTMAFGDYLNDLELLAGAAWPVAMDNAHPLVRERAKLIAPSNSEDGVAQVLEAVFGLAGRG